MNIYSRHYCYRLLITIIIIGGLHPALQAQIPVSNRNTDFLYKHGREQYEQGHYALAIQSLESYLKQSILPTEKKSAQVPDEEGETAQYLVAVSKIKLQLTGAIKEAAAYAAHTSNPVYRQRTNLAVAQYYFQKDSLQQAISYYEAAGIDNLSNDEIGDEKFELGYAYFNEQMFDKAKPLFASIKDLPGNKYYIAGNYYYGLLAYNDGEYDAALSSFDRIGNQEQYKNVVPYYKAEIYYFKGNYDKVLQVSNRYLDKKEKLYYDKELHLLTAQTYFEQKEYSDALPYFEYYYDNSDKIRKEDLYEMAYTYYRLEKWNKAIDKFKQLSNLPDSLGQTSMYLLGDCYLKAGDKSGARSAFGICADMDFNPGQQEAASFLYAKLSYELGYDAVATKNFSNFIRQYPNSSFNSEAHMLLADLLAKSSNFAEAFNIISDLPVKDNSTWALYQKVATGRAMQLMQERDFKAADSVFNLSLQQPVDPAYESIAYFWKSEIAYREHRYPQCVQFANTFITGIGNNSSFIKQISPQATVPNAQLNIGFANMELQHYEQAQQAFAAAQSGNSYTNDAGANADAMVREADAAFMMKDYDKALDLYTNSIAAGAHDPDYALYQKALILGLQKKTDEKIAALNQIINKQPESVKKDDAVYELAVTCLETGRNSDAISLLKNLSDDSNTSESTRAKALLKLAYAYQESGDNKNAADNYKKYLNSYPAASDRATAIDALRNLYITMGRPQDFDAFAKENDLPDIGVAALDKTYYDAAENEYADDNYTKAIGLFKNYLDKYPNGLSAIKAKYYLAESYYQTGSKDSASLLYKDVVDEGWNEFSENAAERAASIAMDHKDYDGAKKYYNVLLQNAIQPDNLQQAYQGLMKTSFETKDYDKCIAYADTLNDMPQLAKDVQANIQLYKAKALMERGDAEQALSIFDSLDSNGSSAIAAQARYYVPAILLQQHKLKDAENKAAYALQSSSGNEYWTVKTYLLMSDILTAEKDYFNAKATLQSVIKNTGDAALKAAAKDKLEQVKALEKKSSKLSE